MSDTAPQNATTEPAQGYQDLKYYFANLNTMFSIRNTLAMDMMTSMPVGGLEKRIHDISSITKRIYAETTTPTVTGLLEKVESQAHNNSDNWSAWDLANLREMRRIHSHLSALTPDLYLASVQISNKGRRKHKAALKSGDWNEAQQYIQQVVDLYKKIGDLKQKKFETRTPYKALLLVYAADISENEMDTLYDNILDPLKDLHVKALAKQTATEPPKPLEGDFSRGDQMWLNKTILQMMGFDFARGDILVTNLAPMTSGSPQDTRVLVRCGDNDTFLDSLGDTLYQGARGLYLQNLPKDWYTQPVGQDQGALIMNALSILYETMIGRTPQFFNFISVRAEGVFRQFKNKSFEPENLYRLKKHVSQTTQRSEAGEISKIFHDILRYRIERDLINGTLAVKDLSDRWNDESKSLIGMEPNALTDGVLQNPDWFTGRFGFIPTNTLSHIVAAEMQNKLFEATPDLSSQIENGQFEAMGNWIKTNIHSKGRSMDALAMVKQATGSKLSESHLLTHLERRFLSDRR